MKTWFTADTHFGHQRIIELCNRPFESVDDMNAALIENINATVPKEDRLVILGDICMGKLEDSLPLLAQIHAAELVLVPGNHDRWSLAYRHSGNAEKQNTRREEFRRRYQEAHDNSYALPDKGNKGWSYFDLTEEVAALDSPLDRATFSHYPYTGDSGHEDRHANLRPADLGQPLVHGHVHGEWQTNEKQFNVGVDVNNYTPVSEDTLIQWMENL